MALRLAIYLARARSKTMRFKMSEKALLSRLAILERKTIAFAIKTPAEKKKIEILTLEVYGEKRPNEVYFIWSFLFFPPINMSPFNSTNHSTRMVGIFSPILISYFLASSRFGNTIHRTNLRHNFNLVTFL